MVGYLTQRLAWTGLTLIAVSLITFLVVHGLPGDVALLVLGPDRAGDPELLAAMRAVLGTDRPLITQYLEWVGGALRGDLGTSLIHKRAIAEDLLLRLPVTLEIATLSLVGGTLLGIPLGLVAATRRGGFDAVIQTFIIFGIAAPNFFLGLAFLLIGSKYFPFIPTLDYVPFTQEPLRNLALLIYPVLSLAIGICAVAAQTIRSTTMEVLRQPFIATARAKGLTERKVIYKHTLRNALIPLLTVTGVQTAYLMGGTVVTETIFALPGLGRMVVSAVELRDYPVVQSGVLVITVLVVAVNLVTDLAYVVTDPRIRYT
jgi:peptide/nickel transport system permease protein